MKDDILVEIFETKKENKGEEADDIETGLMNEYKCVFIGSEIHVIILIIIFIEVIIITNIHY